MDKIKILTFDNIAACRVDTAIEISSMYAIVIRMNYNTSYVILMKLSIIDIMVPFLASLN
jgi:hypothetical protein